MSWGALFGLGFAVLGSGVAYAFSELTGWVYPIWWAYGIAMVICLPVAALGGRALARNPVWIEIRKAK